MNLYSTNNPDFQVDIYNAVLEGLPPDNGLYMLESINKPDDFWKKAEKMPFPELAFEVAKTLLDGAVRRKRFAILWSNPLQFDAPLHQVENDIYSLELWLARLAFKDLARALWLR
ncbi:MAG: hypothetical protein R3B47_19565 [Bacteroidia bacterium]